MSFGGPVNLPSLFSGIGQAHCVLRGVLRTMAVLVSFLLL